MIVSGTFNDGNNSTIIVLLDTFYGAAAGAVVATSVMLVANEPLVQGLQYGAGAGAIAGFGFGLFDTFVLADRSTALAFMQPTWYEIPNQNEGIWQLNQQPGIDFVKLSVRFLSVLIHNISNPFLINFNQGLEDFSDRLHMSRK